jgi:hypothetical protein
MQRLNKGNDKLTGPWTITWVNLVKANGGFHASDQPEKQACINISILAYSETPGISLYGIHLLS